MPGWRTVEDVLEMTPYQKFVYSKYLGGTYIPKWRNWLFMLAYLIASVGLLRIKTHPPSLLVAMVLITFHAILIMNLAAVLIISFVEVLGYKHLKGNDRLSKESVELHTGLMNRLLSITGTSGANWPLWVCFIDVANDVIFGLALLDTGHTFLCGVHTFFVVVASFLVGAMKELCRDYIKSLPDSLEARSSVNIDRLSNQLFHGDN